MYDGYWTYNGVEVVNAARLRAYADGGFIPSGATLYDCIETCDGLAGALGHAPYRSPLLDAPPWFDPDDPDTADFAGVLPTEITGTDGSTRTVELNPVLLGGARSSRPTYGPRTVAVSALLLGRTSAAVEKGLAWLTATLAQGCDAGADCGGADLRGLLACPDVVEGQVDPTTPQALRATYSDIAQFDASGVNVGLGAITATNYAGNPSAEHGLDAITVPSYVDTDGTLVRLPPGAFATTEIIEGLWGDGGNAFSMAIPPGVTDGPRYRWWYTPAVPATVQPAGGPWFVTWSEQGEDAAAVWLVEDDASRVVNGGFESGLASWTQPPAGVATLTPGPPAGGLPPDPSTGGIAYAVGSVVDATNPTAAGGDSVVLASQQIALPAPMDATYRVDAKVRVATLDGLTQVTLRVSNTLGTGGTTATLLAPVDSWGYLELSLPDEIAYNTADGPLYLSVEVPVATPAGATVLIDDISARLVYMFTPTYTDTGIPPTRQLVGYTAPANTATRLGAIIGTDDSSGTTAVYEWDAVRWSPGDPSVHPDLLGGIGDFQTAGAWPWTAFAPSVAPARSNIHAFNNNAAAPGDLPGGTGYSLWSQVGTNTNNRYGSADLSAYALDPGNYVLRAWVYVPNTAPSAQGLAVYANAGAPPATDGTQIGLATITAKNTWTKILVPFTVPTGATSVRLYNWAVTPASTGQMYLDAVAIQAGSTFNENPTADSRYFDGDSPADPDGVYRWEGTAGGSWSDWRAPVTGSWSLGASNAAVSAPAQPPVCDTVRVVWSVTATSGPITVLPSVLINGAVYEVGALTQVAAGKTVSITMSVHSPPSAWVPRLSITGTPDTTFRVNSVKIYARTPLSPSDCLTDYWRTYPDVSTVAGPTVVGKVVFDSDGTDVECLSVEWTWTSGSAYRFGENRMLVAGLTGTGNTAPITRNGVTVSQSGILSADPWNCAEGAPAASCATDPCYPSWASPPAPPVIVDPSAVVIGSSQVNDVLIGVPPSLVVNEGVFSFTLRNGQLPKVGIRIRVWDDALPTYAPGVSECQFAYEYQVDYLAPYAVLRLSADAGGSGEKAEVICSGQLVAVDASAVVRGDWGGPPQPSVAICKRRYAIRMQWLATYPRSCTNFYTKGSDQGDLALDLALAVRES